MSKPIECATPGANPTVNYGFWVIMMCQRVLSTIRNVPFWWGVLIMRDSTRV